MFRELLNLIKPGTALPTDERRDTVRLHCSIAATLKDGKTTREIRVINASLTGLAIELESKLRKKAVVTIHREQFGGAVEGTVVWCRALRGSNRYQVGVTYKEDREMLRASWIKPALKSLGFTVGRINEKRQLTRVPGHHRRCFLKSLQGETYSPGELKNLSLGGALVESEVEIPRGLRLILKSAPVPGIAELVMEAEIKSCKRDPKTRRYLCGLKFVNGDEKLLKKHMTVLMDEC